MLKSSPKKGIAERVTVTKYNINKDINNDLKSGESPKLFNDRRFFMNWSGDIYLAKKSLI